MSSSSTDTSKADPQTTKKTLNEQNKDGAAADEIQPTSTAESSLGAGIERRDFATALESTDKGKGKAPAFTASSEDKDEPASADDEDSEEGETSDEDEAKPLDRAVMFEIDDKSESAKDKHRKHRHKRHRSEKKMGNPTHNLPRDPGRRPAKAIPDRMAKVKVRLPGLQI
ncbi:MAG: hypothetical protein Q9199_002828 [Rusavskia elegans]